MFAKNINIFLLLMSMLLLFSCNTEEEEEEDPYADRHPDFYGKEDFFINDGFKYYEYNKIGYEDTVRTRKELDEHRPIIKIEDGGAQLIISFPKHPHEPKHYWAWFEVVDQNGLEFYEEVDEPSETVENFEFIVVPEKPFKHKIRVRAFCHVHGEFEDYIIIPDFKEKSIIDR